VAITWTSSATQSYVQVHTDFIEVQMLLSYCNVAKQWQITTQDLVWVTDNASNAQLLSLQSSLDVKSD